MLAGSVLPNILMKWGKDVRSIFHDWGPYSESRFSGRWVQIGGGGFDLLILPHLS